MTFADRLEELRKAATKGNYHADSYKNFLIRNADAILELVRAADMVTKYPGVDKYLGTQTFNPLRDALAKLNGEQT